MATISKSGISNGSTIESEHITRIIDALDGTSSAEIIATGSFTGTTRTSKDSVLVDNTSAITGHPSGSGIYPGMVVNVDLSLSGTNGIHYTFGPRSEYSDGDTYEFIITRAQGSSEYLRVDCDATVRIYGTILGADNSNVHASGQTSVRSGLGNGVIGDRLVFTAISNTGNSGWLVHGIVSGSAGYSVS